MTKNLLVEIICENCYGVARRALHLTPPVTYVFPTCSIFIDSAQNALRHREYSGQDGVDWLRDFLHEAYLHFGNASLLSIHHRNGLDAHFLLKIALIKKLIVDIFLKTRIL